jgi:glycosyltransferase involved in cell wall biosynthesis
MRDQEGLKILLLTSSYPRSYEDTASIFLRYLAEHLAERGLEIHVLAPADVTSGTTVEGRITVHRFQYFTSRLQKLAYGSGIVPNLRRSPWLWLQVPFFVVAMTYSALRVIRRERINLVHAHWIVPQGIVGLIAKFFLKIPLVTTAHGADAFALRGFFARFLKRLAVGWCDTSTTNTHATLAAIVPGEFTAKSRVIPMGVDVDLFAGGDPTSLRRELAKNEFLLLFVGRLVEKKGCSDLLHALSLLDPLLRCRTTLWIVGDGDERLALEHNARQLGIEKKVRFWGTISNRRLPDFYAAANLFVAPSIEAASGDTEGQGVVILEAFAARACVLTTRVGGIDMVVRDNVTGLVLAPNEPENIALAIEKLLNEPRLRAQLVENAFKEVKERYDWKRIAAEFESVYRKLADRPRRYLNSKI